MSVTPKIIASKRVSNQSIIPFNATLPFYFEKEPSYGGFTPNWSLKMDESTSVVLSQSSSSSVTLNLVTTDGTQIILLNTLGVTNAKYAPSNKIKKISNSAFLVVYVDKTTLYPTGAIVTISNNIMNIGTATSLATDAYTAGYTSTYFDVDLFSPTVGIITYTHFDGTATYTVRAKAFTMNVPDITYVGAAYNVGNPNYLMGKSVVCISESRAIILYQNYSSVSYGSTVDIFAEVALSGTNISSVATQTMTSSSYTYSVHSGCKGSDGYAYFFTASSDTKYVWKINTGVAYSSVALPLSSAINDYSTFFIDSANVFYTIINWVVYKYDPVVSASVSQIGTIGWASQAISSIGIIISIGDYAFFIRQNIICNMIYNDYQYHYNYDAFNICAGAANKIVAITSIYLNASGAALIAGGLNLYIKTGGVKYLIFTTQAESSTSYYATIDENNIWTTKPLTLRLGGRPITLNEGEEFIIEIKSNFIAAWTYDITAFGYEEDI